MNATSLEKIIISALLNDGDYSRKVMPYTKPEFFSTNEASTVTQLILDYNEKYSSLPTASALIVELENRRTIPTMLFTDSKILIESIFKDDVVAAVLKLDKAWILDKTEKYFRQQ